MTGSGEGVNEVGGNKFLTEQPKGVDPTKTSLHAYFRTIKGTTNNSSFELRVFLQRRSDILIMLISFPKSSKLLSTNF